MPGLQQKVVVKKEQATNSGLVFMGLPVYSSNHFQEVRLIKYHKRFRNKRLWKKWYHRYGGLHTPRMDADICGSFLLCHPSVLWRFEAQTFIDAIGDTIPEEEHDIHL